MGTFPWVSIRNKLQTVTLYRAIFIGFNLSKKTETYERNLSICQYMTFSLCSAGFRNDLDLAELQDPEVDPIELAGAFEGDIILANEEQLRLINDVSGGGRSRIMHSRLCHGQGRPISICQGCAKPPNLVQTARPWLIFSFLIR